MTEPQIREFAKTHGLKVLKRITTGNDARHFATFEVFPEEPKRNNTIDTCYARNETANAVIDAWRKLRTIEDPNRLKGEKPFTTFHARSAIIDLPWIEFDGVWCEPRKIITELVYPPIPNRNHDWQASFDGDEPNDNGQMLTGHGATEQEAIDALLEAAS